MATEPDETILDSGIPKSRALAGWLGFSVLILIIGYFVVGASMIGLPIREMNLARITGFAIVAIPVIFFGNRFGNQLSREVVILKDGILIHQEQYFWMKRKFFLVKDEVGRFELRTSAFSFTVFAVTANGRRIVARDIGANRKEEYLSVLGKFAPVTPTREAVED